MKKFLEGSRAIAETAALCRPKVVSAYPITPQTHIVEELAYMKSEGQLSAEYVRAESEFAAASIVLGASATGVRTYTATSSQGLLLMAEVIFNIAGMRLPIVMTCANRSVSAPINIWNDYQDAMTIRDSGWIMLFAETNQEACDMHIQAYKIAEKLNLPVMVNMDGFALTHTYEPVNLLTQKQADEFLPEYKPKEYLDPRNPKTFGYLAMPNIYMEMRDDLFNDVNSSKSYIDKVFHEFKNGFNRGKGNGFIEEYRCDSADLVFVAMGSIVGTLREAVDSLRDKGIKAGILKIKSFRPFPIKEVIENLSHAKHIAVLDKAVSLGFCGNLALEIKAACQGKIKPIIQSYILGLGGRDIRVEMLTKIANDVLKSKEFKVKFIGK
jgi:pyruvate ferredoxin oxidoreductase alpha subunit